jgi:hypothetical protein
MDHKPREGRPRKLESPAKLWGFFEHYKAATKANPFKVQDYVGKDGGMVYREKERCLTLEGFDCYLSDKEIISSIEDYDRNYRGAFPEYADVCARIRREIRCDQIEGGMAGVYSTSITQRLNNLKESSEVTTTSVQVLSIDPLAGHA